MTTITIGDCVEGVAGIGRASLLEERFSVRVTAQVKNAAMEKEYLWVAKVSLISRLTRLTLFLQTYTRGATKDFELAIRSAV